jgi:starch-binding outer membrane protein, SusD/RagB family
MKFKSFYITLVAFFLVAQACNEDFLDVSPEQGLDLSNSVRDLKTLRSAVNGLYSNLQDNDLYGRSLLLVPELMTDNAFISRRNANRYLPQNEYRVIPTDAFNRNTWTDAYEVVANANGIIRNFPKATILESEKPEANHRLGEAYAMKALTYFALVRYYAQPFNFSAGAGHPGIAIISPEENERVVSPSRATVGEVYNQIVRELETAMPLLTLTESGRFTKEAGQALLAKVYLYMEKWADAEKTATAIIDSKKFKLLDTTNFVKSWDSDFGAESILEIVNTDVDNAGFDAISYFYAQGGYGDGLATEDLYNAYSATDVRRQLIQKGVRPGTGGENPAYIVKKYPSQSSASGDNIRLFRLADIYLIRAEARAEQGAAATALEDLNRVAQRVDSRLKPYTGLSGVDLVDAILKERRKELAFEGERLYDLTRKKKSFTKIRTDAKQEIAYPSDKTIGPIPQAELDANKNMTQNKGY